MRNMCHPTYIHYMLCSCISNAAQNTLTTVQLMTKWRQELLLVMHVSKYCFLYFHCFAWTFCLMKYQKYLFVTYVYCTNIIVLIKAQFIMYVYVIVFTFCNFS